MRPADEPKDATIGMLVAWAQGCLHQAGIEAPRREARLLLAWTINAEPADLLRRDAHTRFQPAEIERFVSAVRRRATREPLAYITGRQGFWTLDLAVSTATLIPRADSETVIELLLHLHPDRTAALRVLDLGTGTGCLLLAALSEYPVAWGVGIDLSMRACALAAHNAAACGLQSRARFVCGSWSDPIRTEGAAFDLVLSNPPYVPAADIAGLMPEVARFEPGSALDGGTDGFNAYRTILAGLPNMLSNQGVAIFEIGAGQAEAVTAFAVAVGLEPGPTRKDLSGIVRAVCFRRS